MSWQLHCQIDTTLPPLGQETLDAYNLLAGSDSGNVTITSVSRTSKSINDLPITAIVIGHAEIIKNQYMTLTDILKTLPGMQVANPGLAEFGESFTFRGLTGNVYAKILINGFPVKPTVVRGMPIGNQLPIRQAERIEIIYGPAAAVYGADAVSGVINIVTKEAKQGAFVRGDVSLGANEYNNINFTIGGKAGKNRNIFDYSFYGSKTEFNSMNIMHDNQDVYNPLNYYKDQTNELTYQGNTFEIDKIDGDLLVANGIDTNQFKKDLYGSNYQGTVTAPQFSEIPAQSHMVGFTLRYRGFTWGYQNMYRQSHSSIGKTTALYKYNNPRNFWGETIHLGYIGYSKQWRRFSSTTNISSLTYRMDNSSSLGLTFKGQNDKSYIYSASDDVLFEQVFAWYPRENFELVGGFSSLQSGNLPLTNYLPEPFETKYYTPFSNELATSDSLKNEFGINPVVYNTSSVFMQAYYVWKKWSVMAAFRSDYNELYADSYNPRLAVLYKFNPFTSVRGSWGWAFRAPPSSFIYQSNAYQVPGTANIHYMNIPNENLTTEFFGVNEIGFKFRLFKRLYFDQSFYLYEIKDHLINVKNAIDPAIYPRAANDSAFQMINAPVGSISRVFGSQTNILYEDIFKSIHLDAELSLSYSERSDELPNIKNFIEENLSLMPNHMGKLKLTARPTDRLYLRLENVWMSKWLRLLIPFENIYQDLFENVDGYYTIDFLVRYQLGPNISAYLKFNNLLNEKYGIVSSQYSSDNLPYIPQLGRNGRFGLTFTLN